LESNLGFGDSKLGFWDEKWDFRDSQLSQLATASKLAREASNIVTESHVCPPRRATLLATASIVSQEACFARHGEQRGDREGSLPATASYSAWEASCLSSSFSVLRFVSFSHSSVLN